MNQPPNQPPPQAPYPQGPYPAHVADGKPPPRSALSIAAFIISLAAFIFGIIPFVGFLGVVALVLAVVDLTRSKDDPGPSRNGFSIAALVFSAGAILGAFIWVWIFQVIASSAHGSCPHVYAYDGGRYRLDADLVSGALFHGAERTDVDRLESVRAVDGEYRLSVRDDLEEIDHVDSLALVVVDHDGASEILPTELGALVAVKDAAPPIRAVDSAGNDALPALVHQDGQVITGSAAPREAWTLTFARPEGDRAVLVLRGRMTDFAERAYAEYLARMGQSVGPLMAWAFDDSCNCTREHVAREPERLGLPLSLDISSDGGAPVTRTIGPIGRGGLRSQALPIELAAGSGPITVRIEATSRFWEIDQLELAPASRETLAEQWLEPTAADFISSSCGRSDVTDTIRRGDEQRVSLHSGDRIDVRFVAPPLKAGKTRTALVSLRGYYEVAIGGARGINLAAIAADRWGLTSLPSFAAAIAPPAENR